MINQSPKVGFQGTKFSYSEKAAVRLVEEHHLENAILIPLESSWNVAERLRSGEIDYGVVALQNTVGGDVKETEEAFLTSEWVTKCKVIIDINHCLFSKSPSISVDKITKVASHEQALRQCKNSISKIIGKVEFVEETDTANCARLLAEGQLPESCAVVCSKEAGEARNLHLLAAGIQDHKNNRTEFALLSLGESSSNARDNKNQQFFDWLCSETVFPHFQKIGVTVLVLGAFLLSWLSSNYFPSSFSISLPQAMITMSGLSLAFVSASSQLRLRYSLGLICGYWIYMDKIIKGSKDPNQIYAIPRVVRISRNGAKLQLRGWICERPSRPYFQSSEVFHDDFMLQNGSLVYKYQSNLHQGVAHFDGIVILEWSKAEGSYAINNMYGRYFGFMTNTQGELNFRRISVEKFREHRGITSKED